MQVQSTRCMSNQTYIAQVRQLMGHAQFGARVVYGDCIFFTISPNEQHSAFVLRLSRYRAKDPYLQEATEHASTLRDMGKRDLQPLERSKMEVPIPEYEQRRIITARDPLAVMEAYIVNVRVKLAHALGLRMCSICPRGNETGHPCQDKFGSNMMPLGGILGGCVAIGAATEHQGVGTPHLHGNIHLACVYQYSTLQEIAMRISEKAFEPERVKNFQAWMHKEDPPVPSQHADFEGRVEQEWQQRFAGSEHDSMCSTPAYMTDDERPTMWAAAGPSLPDALADAAVFKKAYLEDVQFIFSRVQHHVHKKTKKGYFPLKACLSKRCKKGSCKAGFPKEAFLTEKMVVVCPGVARKIKLSRLWTRQLLGQHLGTKDRGVAERHTSSARSDLPE